MIVSLTKMKGQRQRSVAFWCSGNLHNALQHTCLFFTEWSRANMLQVTNLFFFFLLNKHKKSKGKNPTGLRTGTVQAT